MRVTLFSVIDMNFMFANAQYLLLLDSVIGNNNRQLQCFERFGIVESC